MEPTYYLRVLRLRWKILAVCAVLGAIAGLAITLFENRDDGEEVAYWLANHKLVVSLEASEEGRLPNLLQTALLVTGGDVPAAVGVQLDVDEAGLSRRIRTVADTEVNVIEISAIGTDPNETGALADAFASELIVVLGSRDVAAWEVQVVESQSELEQLAARLELTSAEARVIEGELDEAERRANELDLEAAATELDPDLSEEERAEAVILSSQAAQTRAAELEELRSDLRSVETELASRKTLFEQGLALVDSLENGGPPADLMETLDVVAPFQISPKRYTTRLQQGIEGNNNFASRNVDDGSGGGLRLAQTVSNPVVRTGLGAIAGLLVGIGAALLHLRLDPRLRVKADIEAAFGLPVLAEIPRFDKRDSTEFELHTVTRSRSIVAETYRMVRSALLFARATTDAPFRPNGSNNGSNNGNGNLDAPLLSEREVRVIMVTSPGPSEGKTTTTANLAAVLAEAGYEVLVVNCDYRLPKLHKFFGQTHQCRRTLPTDIEGVTLVADVVDPGRINPTTVVESQRALIDKARKHYDVVLLDTAPLLATNDALGLLPVVDMVLLVAREGRTDREAAAETVDVLKRRRANLAGVVVTDSSGFGRSRYYYKYRYGAYYDAASAKPDKGANFDFGPKGRMRDRAARKAARSRVSVN